MSDTMQFRFVFSNLRDGSNGVCFIDAPSEAAARIFFAVAFPLSIALNVTLEAVDPCASYEKRAVAP